MGSEAAFTPHILLVSFPAQGHVNPLLRFAKRLAAKGLLVTFSSSLDIGHRITSSTKTKPETLIPIGKGHLRFEFFSDGWEDNDLRRSEDLEALMFQLRTVGSAAVFDLIHRQASKGCPISCVINNPFVPWVLDVAHDLNIPSACLWVQSCAVFSTYYHYFHKIVEFPSSDNPDAVVKLPGIPELKPQELPTFLLESNIFKSLTEVILSQFKNIDKATWVFANSFEELERDAIDALSDMIPLITMGPLVDNANSEVKGDLWKAADCMEWLNAQEDRSVVYVSLGSVAQIEKEKMVEMANGLLDSDRPFIWVVREDLKRLLPNELMEEIEMKSKGMLISWSPQEQVLSHRAVACFLTHCGWNSTLEVLAAGVPVIAYPQWGDQVPDAKFLVDVYGVGVRLNAPVKREELVKCVGEVNDGEHAGRMKKNALKWKQAANKALAEGGSSDRNIQAFVDEIMRMTCSNDEIKGLDSV